MKRLHMVVLITCVTLIAQTVFAQASKEHESHHPDTSNVSPAATEDEAKGEGGMGKMDSMQQNMRAMHELMEKIHSSSDSAEKTQLLKQHMQAMRDQMKVMKKMNGGAMMGMMDSSAGPGTKKQTKGMVMMCGGKKGAKSEDIMMKCHRRMQVRMDMMQDMISQILEHEEAELEHGN